MPENNQDQPTRAHLPGERQPQSGNEVDQHKFMLDSINSPVLALDNSLTVIYCNQAYADYAGQKVEAITGKQLLDLFPEVGRLSYYQAHLRALETGENQEVEGWGPRQTYLRARIFPAEWGLLSIAEDISEQKRTERVLAESEQKSSGVIEQAVDGIALHTLSLDVTSTIQLPQVLQKIVDQAVKLLNAAGGRLYLCEPEAQRVRLAVEMNGARRDLLGTVLAYGEGAAGLVAETGEPLIVDDYTRWDARAAIYEGQVSYGPILSVPMLWQGEVTGVLQVHNETGKRKFNLTDQELLSLFANQAAATLENARLLQVERSQLLFAKTLQEVGALLTSELGLQEVLEKILDLLARVIAYDSASIHLLEAGGQLNMAAGRGFPDIESARQVVRTLSEHISSAQWQTTEAIVIPDTTLDERWVWHEDTRYIQSWVGAPLLVKGRLIGTLNVDSRSKNAFTPQNAETILAFANQAAIAIENARLFEAERKARERSEVLREAAQIVGSKLSQEKVFEAMLEQIARVVPYDSGNVMLVDGSQAVVKFWRGYEAYSGAARMAEVRFDLNRDQTISPIVKTNQPLMIAPVRQDPRWQVLPVGQHIQSWLGVPLSVGGQVIGIFSLDRVSPEGFSDEEIALAVSLATHASIAIENARMFEKADDRTAELEALRQASLSVTSSLELPDVLDAILENALNLLPDAGNGHIFLYHPEDGGRLTFGTSLSDDGRRGEMIAEPRPDGLTYTVARSGEMQVVPDMGEHPLFENAPSDWEGAILGLPLHIGNRVVGVMNVSYKRPRLFSEEELRLLGLLADQAAIAIENARLFEQAATERMHMSLLAEIGRSVTTSFDPDKILEMALNLTCQALGGIAGQTFLHRPDENKLSLRQLYGRPDLDVAVLDQQLDLHLGNGLAGWVAENKQAVYVPDVTSDPRWFHVNDLDDDVRSGISAPILIGGQLVGVISVLHQQPAAFSEQHLSLLQAICQEVGLALSNAERYQQVQRRLAEMVLIQNLAQTFNQRLNLQKLLEEVVLQLAEQLSYPQIRIFLVEGEELVVKAYYGPRPPKMHYSLFEGIIGRTARTGEIAFVPDVYQDKDYLGCVDDTISELAVPIFREKSVVGVINIETHIAGQITSMDRSLLQVLAGQIAVALENAVLFDRVSSHAEELEATVARRTLELSELYELSQKIGYTLSFEDLYRLLLTHLRTALHIDLVAGGLFLDTDRALYINAGVLYSQSVVDALRDYLQEVVREEGGQTLTGRLNVRVFSGSGSLNPNDMVESLAFTEHALIYSANRVVGALVIASREAIQLGDEQKRLLDTFANQAAGAIERLRAMRIAEQKRLEGLVEHLPVGVILLDAEHRMLVANPVGQSILATFNPVFSGDRLDHIGPYAVRDLIARHADPFPVDLVFDEMPRRIFEAQIRPIGRGAERWILTMRDVTQERDSQTRIQMQERLATVGQLAAGIAHDFNNIMAAILVYADLLMGDPDLPATSRERIDIIQQQVQRAASLIRQILDFSRRAVMEQSVLDLLPFIKELDKMMRRVLPETIRLELSYAPGSYNVQADPARLQQVFINLALNARDAMPEGGLLRFELSYYRLRPEATPLLPDMAPGNWVRIAVTDTGVGIPPEVLPHIFEPFFTTKPVGQGTGLGLAQVYGIVKQHDGHIDVHSRVGRGTTVAIFLPAQEEEELAASSLDAPAYLDGAGTTVLVVEDDLATREALRALLETHNYQVISAANGIQALEYFDRHQYHISLVVSDIVMPQMGGLALYQALKERLPDIRMLFVTGHPLEGESQALLERGVVHWLQKPFSVRDFIRAVNLLLE